MNKQLLALILIFFVAATITDETTTDFNQGTPLAINTSNNELTITASGGNYSAGGEYRSQVFDLGSNPEITLSWSATTPPQTGIIVNTRTGPTPTISGWSSWSSALTSPTGSAVTSPLHRYLQYRIQLTTTNQSTTPRVENVTIDYVEQGPLVSTSSLTQDLTEQYNDTYSYYVDVQDTLNITSVTARYRIGTDAYSPYEPMTLYSSDVYYTNITQPAENWISRSGEDITIQVRADNTNFSTQETFTQEITPINDPPTINQVLSRTALEGEEVVVQVFAQDPDDDTLSYSTSHGTITKITNEQAEFRWTPTRSDVGAVNVTIQVTDGEYTATTTPTITTTLQNYPPELRVVQNQTGYYQDTLTWTIIADDQNINDNLTFTSTPRTNINTSANIDTTVYTATASAIALDDFKGEQTITFRVQDEQGATDTITATSTINYCGDNVCQVNENQTSCQADCKTTQITPVIALELPNRICTNTSTSITSYNASSRYSCYVDGKTLGNNAYCHVLEDTDLTVYKIVDQTQLLEQETLTTDQYGLAAYTPPTSGRYEIHATRDGMQDGTITFTASQCLETQEDTQLIENEPPEVTKSERPIQTPRQERPQFSQEETNMLVAVLIYALIPILIAGVLYGGFELYEQHKNTNETLLKARIFATKASTAIKKPFKKLRKRLNR